MENLFTGNIIHRTDDKEVGYLYHGVQINTNCVSLYEVKLNAILYQTEDGDFIDYDEMFKGERFPSLPLSTLQSADDGLFMGIFVDSESLMPYNERLNENNMIAKTK